MRLMDMMDGMKSLRIAWLWTGMAVLAALFSGCGEGGGGAGADGSAERPGEADARGQTEFRMTVDDSMRYPVRRLTVAAGQQLTLRLVHAGSMSLEQMGHNWVLLAPDLSVESFIAEASGAVDTGYIPEGWEEGILAQTDLIGGGGTSAVTFTAPETPGEYPYVCTFPGHFFAGMKGVLVVK